MLEKKVTTLAIKVDLGCEKCRKKIKKILCEIPQIQDQVYDEKKNTVTVKVVCCSPDKVKEKICCKGGKTIEGIEIVKPPPPKQLTDEKPRPKPKTKPDVKVVVVVKMPEPKPAPAPNLTLNVGDHKPCQTGQPPPPPSGRQCCVECSQGYGGGPCWRGRPAAAGPCYEYDGGCGRPVDDSWGDSRSFCYRGTYCTSRCTDYMSDENPNACSIM